MNAHLLFPKVHFWFWILVKFFMDLFKEFIYCNDQRLQLNLFDDKTYSISAFATLDVKDAVAWCANSIHCDMVDWVESNFCISHG